MSPTRSMSLNNAALLFSRLNLKIILNLITCLNWPDCTFKTDKVILGDRLFSFSNLVALGCIQGSIASLYLFNKSGVSRFLAVYLALLSINMCVSFYIDSGLFDSSMKAMSVWRIFNSYLLLGPLLLAFVVKMIKPERKFCWIDCLHFIPLLFSLGFSVLLSPESLSSLLQTKAENIQQVAMKPIIGRFTVSYLIPATQFGIYLLVSSWYVFQLWLKQRNQPISPQLCWLISILAISFLMMLNTFVVFIVTIIMKLDKTPDIFALANLFLVLGFFAVTYLLIRIGRPESITERSTIKAIAKSTTNKVSDQKKTTKQQLQLAQLDQLMIREKLYLNAELSQIQLAEHLQLSRHQFSELLALHPAGNFYELVNQLRVKAVVDAVNNRPISDKLTNIAYDCGFNSKSSFNQVFKKHMHQTPSQFRKAVKAQNSD